MILKSMQKDQIIMDIDELAMTPLSRKGIYRVQIIEKRLRDTRSCGRRVFQKRSSFV